MNTDELRDPISPPEPPEPEADASNIFGESPAEAAAPELNAPESAPPAEGLAAEVLEQPVGELAELAPPPEVAEAVAEPHAPAGPVEAVQDIAVPEPAPAAESYDLPQALFDAGFDVEAALGALAFEPEGADEEGSAPSAIRLPPFTPSGYQPRLPMPAPIRVRRASLGSLIPALALIGVGAWLTVAQFTGAPVDPLLVGAVLSAGLVLSFLVAWLGNGRWSRGLLLVVLLAVFGAGGGALILSAGLFNALAAYPLLFSALGVAILLTAFLARPSDRALLGPALVFITAGIVGYLVLNGALPAGLLSGAAAYWFVPAIILLILIALPLFVRRRG